MFTDCNGLLPGGTQISSEPIWLLIGLVLWHSPGIKFTLSTQATTLRDEYENNIVKITFISPRGNELKQLQK